MPRTLTILLLTAYCIMAAFTQVEGEAGIGISGRVIAADFFALGLFLPAFFVRPQIQFMPNFWFYAAFLAAVLASLFLAARPGDGMVEYLVLVFNFVVGIMLFNLFVNTDNLSLADTLNAFFYATAIVAVLSLLKLFFFPDWFGGASRVAGLVGPFRNTGQSGTFFGMGLALFIPAIATGLIKRNTLNFVLLSLIVLCLILTVKRAAIIGFIMGVLGMLFTIALTGPVQERARNLAVFAIALFVAPIAYYLIDYLIENAAGFDYRVSYKVSNFSTESVIDKFFGENLGAAVNAFNDRPLMGVGVGNIIGEYTTKYEIHSTPFSILSSSGAFGFMVYLVFMAQLLSTVWDARKGPLTENRFMQLVFPMLIGLCVSWLYTYHIRKREFWVLYAILLFGAYLISRYRQGAGRQMPASQQTQPAQSPNFARARP